MADNEEILAGLAEIVEEVAGVAQDDVTADKSFMDDLDIDSLSMVEIAVQAEDKFGVKIPDDELANLKTVGDAVNYIAGQVRLSLFTSLESRGRMSNIDVVVTGIGATTPLGGTASTWDGLLAGRSGIRTIDADWVESTGCRSRSPAAGRRADRGPAAGRGPPAGPLRAGGHGRRPAGLGGCRVRENDDEARSSRSGSAWSSAPASAARSPCSARTTCWKRGPAQGGAADHADADAQRSGRAVGLALKARAGVHAPVSACASGAEGMAWAYRMISCGEVDVVVAGGAEACIHPIRWPGSPRCGR